MGRQLTDAVQTIILIGILIHNGDIEDKLADVWREKVY
jgi:hypothetical protein